MIYKVGSLDSILALNNSNMSNFLFLIEFPCFPTICPLFMWEHPLIVWARLKFRLTKRFQADFPTKYVFFFFEEMVSEVFSNWLPFIREMRATGRSGFWEKRLENDYLEEAKLQKKKIQDSTEILQIWLEMEKYIFLLLSWVSQLFSAWETELWLRGREAIAPSVGGVVLLDPADHGFARAHSGTLWGCPPLFSALIFRANVIVCLLVFFQTSKAIPCLSQQSKQRELRPRKRPFPGHVRANMGRRSVYLFLHE